MKDFRFLSYKTEYSCSGAIRKKMSSEACFAYVFKRIKNNDNVNYIIKLYKGTEYGKHYNKSNACVFSRTQVKNHINQLKRLYPINSRVTDEGKYFKVILSIRDAPALFHKYALTWVRYLYEYPYNMILRDAYLLKEDPRFRFESIANLYNLVVGCFQYNVGGGHSCTNTAVKRLTIQELRKKLEKLGSLNDIYYRVRSDIRINDYYGDYECCDLEYWTSEDLFNIRKQSYLEAYNKIK